MKNMWQVKLVLVAVLALVLSGCVTTKESVFTNDAAPEEAASKRLELARSYIGEGDWENAKRNLKQAELITPNSAPVHEAFALVYQSTGEYELAEENFKRALALQKDFPRARNNYAAFLYQQDRFEEAEKQLELVVKDTLYKGRPRAFVNLGLCRLRLNDLDGAREAFERALTMDRTSSMATLELAFIAYEQQEYRQAQQYYDRYRTMVPRPSARGLWLAVRIAHARDDVDNQASHALALRSLYPDSAEYEAYQNAKRRGEL